MNIIGNISEMLETCDFLGEGNYRSMSKIMEMLNEEEPADTILVSFKVKGESDGIFYFSERTKDGCCIYTFSSTVS